MAQFPLALHLGSYAQFLPLGIWAVSRPRTRAAALIAIGGAFGGIGDQAGVYLARLAGNNHITSYIDVPAMTAFFLFGLREWQLSGKEQRAITIGIAMYLLACVYLVAFVEDVNWFNLGISPLSSTVLMIAGAWTLLRRAAVTEQIPVIQTDWFWASLGLASLGGATLAASQLGALLMDRGEVPLFKIAWQIRAVLVAICYSLVSWGIYRGPPVSKFATVD